MAEKEIPEFERFGSIKIEEYIKGLKAEFEGATEGVRKLIKAELDRVSKVKSTAVAVSDNETA